MRRDTVIRVYKALSEEDQRIFRRWAKANYVVTLILAIACAAVYAGLLSGGNAPTPNHEAFLQVR